MRLAQAVVLALFVWVCESDGMVVKPRNIRWHRDSQGRRYGVHFTDAPCGHVHQVPRGYRWRGL